MERFRLYVQSASRLYSVELAIFFLAVYASLFGFSLAMLIHGLVDHSTFAILNAAYFAIMSLACLIVEAQVIRSIATRSAG